MQTRPLGPDGPMTSALGFGAMSFAGFYGQTDTETSHATLDAALELGITMIDTANVYGNGVSESVIGSYLADRPEARARFQIATKAGICRDPETGRRYFDNSPEHLASELDGSLRRLGIEQIDLYYVHRRDPDREIEEVTETLAGFVQSGKIARFGFSEIAPTSLRRAAAVHPVAAVQSEYSLATRLPDLGLVQSCAELGTTLVAFSPVGRGLLTDTPPDGARAEATAFMRGNPRFVEPNLSRNVAATDAFRALAAEFGIPAAGLAIAWLLHRDDGIVPIPGTRTAEHLSELARGTEVSLSADDMARIESVLPLGWAHGDRYSDAQWIGPERYG